MTTICLTTPSKTAWTRVPAATAMPTPLLYGSYFSFYCKLKTVSVKAGDKVKTGQALGTVDTIAGESQLHFQIWKGTTPQNPELWLK